MTDNLKDIQENKNADPFNLNPGSIEEYIRKKVSGVVELVSEFEKLEAELKAKKIELDQKIAVEMNYLKQNIGLNNLQSKARGLSKLSNKSLGGEDNYE